MGVSTKAGLSLYLSMVKFRGVLEAGGVVALAEGRISVNLGCSEANASGSGEVVLRVVVRGRLVPGLGSISATNCFTGRIRLRNKFGVETSGREHSLVSIDAFSGEDASRLFSDSLAHVSISLDVGSVTGVPGNSHIFTRSRGLGRHIVRRCSVEVVVSPSEEILVLIIVSTAGVADVEFSS